MLGYPGSKKDGILSKLLDRLPKDGVFYDVFAGSNQVTWSVVNHLNLPCKTNDRAYFSSVVSQALFKRKRVSQLAAYSMWKDVEPRPGWLSSSELGLNREAKKYLDGAWAHLDTPLARASLGKIFSSMFRFTRISMISYWSTPEELLGRLRRTTHRMSKLTLSGDVESFNLDAFDFLNSQETLDIVYMDPAWPFKDDVFSAALLYDKYEDVDQFLLQQDLTHRKFWETGEEAIHMICLYVDLALEKGARKVFVATQSSNSPSSEIVKMELERRFNITGQWVVTVPSRMAKKRTTTEFMFEVNGS